MGELIPDLKLYIKVHAFRFIKKNFIYPVRKHKNPVTNFQEFIGLCKKRGGIVFGTEYFDEAKDAVLFVSHELGLTGAPIALMNYALAVRELGKQPLIISPLDGKLRELYLENGIPVIILPKLYISDAVPNAAELFSEIVLNTIISVQLIPYLRNSSVKVIWWVHEAYAAYTAGNIINLPGKLPPNVSVLCVGPYASGALKKYRPGYDIHELLYYLPENNKYVPASYSPGGLVTFACIGQLDARKSQDLLCRAIRMLTEDELKRCRFIFVGRSGNAEILSDIEELCRDFPEYVSYKGELAPVQVADVYSHTDCLICPSSDDPMPIVVTEAMMYSKQIICSSSTGSAELLQGNHAGIVFESGNADRLCTAIREILNCRPEASVKMAMAARKIYEDCFSKNVYLDNIRKYL